MDIAEANQILADYETKAQNIAIQIGQLAAEIDHPVNDADTLARVRDFLFDQFDDRISEAHQFINDWTNGHSPEVCHKEYPRFHEMREARFA